MDSWTLPGEIMVGISPPCGLSLPFGRGNTIPSENLFQNRNSSALLQEGILQHPTQRALFYGKSNSTSIIYLLFWYPFFSECSLVGERLQVLPKKDEPFLLYYYWHLQCYDLG